jgi:hypothetical protein
MGKYLLIRMKQTRQVVAIALVAAALCADRAVASATTVRPQATSAAGRLVARLSTRFQRVVPAVRVYETRRDGLVRMDAPAIPSHATPAFPASSGLSPLLLNLPPPAV